MSAWTGRDRQVHDGGREYDETGDSTMRQDMMHETGDGMMSVGMKSEGMMRQGMMYEGNMSQGMVVPHHLSNAQAEFGHPDAHTNPNPRP